MTTDKVLLKIQNQIKDLAPTLELFVDQKVQPSVSDCQELQKQLIELQENIAVYKYNKQNKEISPSFTLHAKISEVEVVNPVPVSDPFKPITETKTGPEPVVPKKEEPKAASIVSKESQVVPEITTEDKNTVPEKEENLKPVAPLSVGINDKFRFINELFAQNSVEYNIAVEQINNLKNWSDTEIYLNSLKNVYDWKENLEVVKYFYFVVKKRFD